MMADLTKEATDPRKIDAQAAVLPADPVAPGPVARLARLQHRKMRPAAVCANFVTTLASLHAVFSRRTLFMFAHGSA